jgi:putative PIN family toxin of toxin-antitoxin system
MRLVLDTCVIVAAVKSRAGASRVLVELVASGGVETVITVPLVNQYEEVLYRPANRIKEWTDDRLAKLVNSLLAASEWVNPRFSYRPTLQDEGDELVLEAAINGRADIVTFNVRDFEPASQFGIRILRPGEVLRELYQGDLSYGEE